MLLGNQNKKSIVGILFLICVILFSVFFLLHDRVTINREAEKAPSLTKNIELKPNAEPSATNFEEEYYDINDLDFRAEFNLEKQIVTVRWKKFPQVTRYAIRCYKRVKKEWEKIDEKTVYPDEKSVYRNRIIYGKMYKYEIAVYENFKGRELLCSIGSDDCLIVSGKVGAVLWQEDDMPVTTGKKNSIELVFRPSEGEGIINDFQPSCFEIYKGESVNRMFLLDTIDVKKNKKVSYKYRDKKVKKGVNYFYKIKSYITIDGVKRYGESSIKELSLDDSWGECKIELLNSKKNKLDKIELVLTSKEGNKPLKLGKKFVKDKDVLKFHFDGDISGFGFVLDEISYKREKSKKYRILSATDEILIRPNEKIYICFRRKNHKKFDNPITVDGTMEANMLSVYLFEYKGHKAFLSAHFTGKEWVSYIKWKDSEEVGYFN